MAEILDEDQLEFLREELESWWISPHGNTIWWLGGTDANREGEISFFQKKSSFPSNNGQRLHCNFEFKHSEKDK